MLTALSLWCTLVYAQTERIATSSVANLSDYQSVFAREASAAELKALQNRLESHDTVRGNFVQHRQLQALNKPLVSSGVFVFDKQQGMIWKQNKPFDNSLIITPTQLLQQNSQGQVQDLTSSDTGSVSRLFPSLIGAMLGGDITELKSSFQLYLPTLTSGEQWQLGLIPKDPLLAKAISKLVLSGDSQPTHLLLFSDNGDISQISLSQFNYASLSPSELALFSPKASQ